MVNVKVTQTKDGKINVQFDPTEDQGPSKSGKTIIVASTQGNIPIPGTELTMGLNVYKKR